ncbi:unnamed protein product [Schistocephalus solidus]|uniref:Neur_chan_LBD domain-containing protein n=1 Tax=Schistocephalus solidus TaxID=70667 RepID=A0A183SFQ1_SCHSO|nr:unnamed protein product [Schistocephalus solidus]
MTSHPKKDIDVDTTPQSNFKGLKYPFPFYEEAMVPDFPRRQDSRKEMGQELTANLMNVVPTNPPLENLGSQQVETDSYLACNEKRMKKTSSGRPLEKSVTWHDNKNKKQAKTAPTVRTVPEVSEESSNPKSNVEEVGYARKYKIQDKEEKVDELINILSDLCDALSEQQRVNADFPCLTSDGETQVSSSAERHKCSPLEFPMKGYPNHDEELKERKEKVIVEVRVVFLKIGEIDTLKEYYQADAFIQAKWREPKLDGKGHKYLSATTLDQYWNPLCYVDNILSETKEVRWLSTQLSPKGEVYIVERRRVRGVFLETLELNDFPLDVQVM